MDTLTPQQVISRVVCHERKCDADISDSFQDAEPDVGIMSGGYYCDACDLPIDGDHYDGDEGSGGLPPVPSKPLSEIGTPISELSGRPGHPGYAEFVRIAKSWGYN